MDAQLKQKWLEALRSGKYDQGESQLVIVADEDNRRNRYCCLGLLAEIAGLNPERFPTHAYLGESGLNNAECGLGPWSSAGPSFDPSDETTHTTFQRKLAGMNDNGKSFAEIADWIEANIPAEGSQS